jgi:hypothetical protein
MSAVTADAVFTDGQPKLVDPVDYRAALKKVKWGEGEELLVRVEPKADALTEAQRRYYFGVCVHPLSNRTGYTEPEMHVLLKAVCLQPGKTSITQLSKAEMGEFIDAVQRYAADVIGVVLDVPENHGAAL